MLKWLWLSVLVAALDLATKAIASHYLVLYQPVPVFPGFNWTLAHNSGAAFSFLSSESGWQRWFFSVIALVVSIGITIWIKRLKPTETWLAVALALVLGGAVGNLWDRVTLGYVVDFIDVYYQQSHWPAFNLADSAISVGAVLLIIDSLRSRHDEDGRKKQSRKGEV
ncbi:MAG TPA: lipoprotein signal peptidase [Gammaproteobacteria bacterium]|nr:lipoprotein signal peptidase [Gammaproteobacteria bacterium]